MIDDASLRRTAAERRLGLDLIEKDYVLGWILKGISECSISDKLIFKGGTALSKMYYPMDWRISEDLDFTLIDNSTMKDVISVLQEELPTLIEELSGGIELTFQPPFVIRNFLRATLSFTGPITRHRTKIEVTREKYLGPHHLAKVPAMYDYPDFSLLTYTLDNILAEKMRSLIERTKIRDYYDTWRLLKTEIWDEESIRQMFHEKCKGKEIVFESVDQFFRDGLHEILEPHLEDLTRMTDETPPALPDMLKELREQLNALLQP